MELEQPVEKTETEAEGLADDIVLPLKKKKKLLS